MANARLFLVALTPVLLAGSLLVGAQAATPDVPPLPPVAETDSAEPEITIVDKPDATMTEYRLGGRLYMVRVKPKQGAEYFLVDDKGDGQLVRQDAQTQIRPPMWVLKRF